jgi:hypothetical protein
MSGQQCSHSSNVEEPDSSRASGQPPQMRHTKDVWCGLRWSHDEHSDAHRRQTGHECTLLTLSEAAHFELRFQSLIDAGRPYAFPYDAAGHVDMDSLSDTARESYLYARAVVGREFSVPAVMVSATP